MANGSTHTYLTVLPPEVREPEPYLIPRVIAGENRVENSIKDGTDGRHSQYFDDETSSKMGKRGTVCASHLEDSEDKKSYKTVHFNPQYSCTVYNITELGSVPSTPQISSGIQNSPREFEFNGKLQGREVHPNIKKESQV